MRIAPSYPRDRPGSPTKTIGCRSFPSSSSQREPWQSRALHGIAARSENTQEYNSEVCEALIRSSHQRSHDTLFGTDDKHLVSLFFLALSATLSFVDPPLPSRRPASSWSTSPRWLLRRACCALPSTASSAHSRGLALEPARLCSAGEKGGRR